MPPKELPKGNAAPVEEQPPKKPRSRFKIIMLIGSLLLLLAGGGGAGYWWLYLRPDATGLSGLFGSNEEAAEAEASGNSQNGTKSASSSAGASDAKSKTPSTASSEIKSVLKPVPLPSLTVNLADPPGNRYFKLGLEVEVNSEEAIKEIQNQNARIRDAIILLLSSKSVKDLTPAKGKVLLKNEIAARLNQILGAPRVVRIFFTDFMIQ